MTDRDLAQQAADHLKKTTISYPSWLSRVRKGVYSPKDGSGTEWGKAFALLDQIGAQPPPPPPPPPPSGQRNPVWLNAVTGGTEKASHLGDYAGVLCGMWEAAAVAKLNPNTIGYVTPVDVNVNSTFGMDYQWAANNDKLLKTTAGTLLVNQGYPGNYVGDVGDTAYQDRFATNVVAMLKAAPGVRGVIFDDILRDPRPLCGTFPARYPSSDTWMAAMVACVKNTAARIRAEGYTVLANASAFTPGDGDSDTGRLAIAWWTALAPLLDGLSAEYWMETTNGTNELRTTVRQWYGYADLWLGLTEVAEAAGAFALMVTEGDSQRHCDYGLATFLLRTAGEKGGFAFRVADNPSSIDPYPYVSRYFNVGQPVSAKSTSSRTFTGANVTVDLAAATAAIVPASG